MSFNTALSAGNLATLRGTGALAPSYQSAAYLSVVPQTIIFRALVNQTSFAASFAQVTFDTTSVGAYTDIVEGMTVYISPSTDLSKATFTGRARRNGAGNVATSTILYINETSATISNNDVITVVNDYKLWDRLGRQVGSTQYVDYDVQYHLPKPIIYGVKSAYAGWVTAGILTLSFTPSGLAVASGATISTWLWNVGDGTITVGSTTTQNITATFPPGHRFISLRVTDSNGQMRTRRISIHAHQPDTYPPAPLQAGDIRVSGDVASGYSAEATAWAGVSTLLDNTLVVIWNDEQYQDGTTALTGDNIAFVGRFRQSSDSAQSDSEVGIIAETRYTVEGVMQQMARLELLPYEFLNSGAPTKFFQLKNLTPWRAVCLLLSEMSTYLELHDLTFDSTADTFLALGLQTQGNNLLAAVNDLYYSINGAMQMNAAGQGQCVRDLRMLSTAARNAAPTIANWSTADLLGIDGYDHANVRTVGRLVASGGSFSSATQQYTTFDSLAPGIAQDYPEASASLDRQILEANQSQPNAQTELNTRSGHAFARVQETDKISVTHPDGYHFLIPALDQWYTFTLDGTETARGIVLDSTIRWLLMSIDLEHDSQSGQKTVRAIYSRETSGAEGQTVVYPPPQDVPATAPSFPPFPIFPAFPLPPDDYLPPDSNVIPFTGNPIANQAVVPLDGNAVAVLNGDTSTIYITTNFLSNGAYPTLKDITPSTVLGTLKHIRAVEPLNGRGLYAISNDSTNSRFHYTADAFADAPVWIDTDLSGALYDFIRVAGSTGGVYLVGETGTSSSGSWSRTYDFRHGNSHGWVVRPYSSSSSSCSGGFLGLGCWGGSYDGTGFLFAHHSDGSHHWRTSGVYLDIITDGDVGTHISSITITWNVSASVATATFSSAGFIGFLDHGFASPYDGISVSPNSGNGPGEIYGTPPSTANEDNVRRVLIDSVIDHWGASDEAHLVEVTLTGTGEAPADLHTIVAYSADYGATFTTPQEVTTTLLDRAGFDTIKLGSASVLGTEDQVKFTSIDGGVYANFNGIFPGTAQPNAIFIPRRQFGSATTGNINTGTPQYLVGSGNAADNNDALWKVTNSGSLFSAITPFMGGTPGLVIMRDSLEMPWQSGLKILETATFAGIPYLCVSLNTGASWHFTSRPLEADAKALRVRKGDTFMRQAFITNGSMVAYVGSYQSATINYVNKYFGDGVLTAIEVFG